MPSHLTRRLCRLGHVLTVGLLLDNDRHPRLDCFGVRPSGRSTMRRPRMRSDSCLQQQMLGTRPSSLLGRTISTLLPGVVALMLLPAIASASPPEPSWIGGIHDSGDGDHIVTPVYETTVSS